MRPTRTVLLTLIALMACGPGREPSVAVSATGTGTEFRGISAAGDSVIWAAGRDGIYARSTDAGRSWQTDRVPGAADLFFIDVHAVDANTAYLLGTHFDGGAAGIYSTRDAGAHWELQYANDHPDVFFDGMAFWDAQHGIAFSDPVDGTFLIVITEDGGRHWNRVPVERIPPPLPNEAGFAASGTAITVHGTHHAWFGTGGASVARVFRSHDRGRSWQVAETPYTAGPTAGIFGVAFRDSLHGVAVGGDYARPHGVSSVLRTDDGGQTWHVLGPSRPPGVRYGVVYLPDGHRQTLVAVGPAGWGYSADDGENWSVIDTTGLNTVTAAPGRVAWAAGVDGRISRVTLPPRP